jgi:PAS domain S-box-containing protein
MDYSLFEARPGLAVALLPDAPAYTVVAVSKDFESITGIKKTEALGHSYLTLFPGNPNDPEFTGEQNLRKAFDHVVSYKTSFELPLQRYDITDENGVFTERYWKAINTPVTDASGEITYIIHTAEDITEHVKAEKKADSFKSIEKAYNFFMSAPVIIGFLKGDDYTIEMANESLLEVWDRTSEVLGKPLVKAIPELEAQGFIQLLDEVRNTGNPFYAYQFPITLLRNGSEEVRYFDFVYKPVYLEENISKASGVISVGHDVTTQVLSQAQLKESEAKYRTLFDAMDQGFCIIEVIFDDNSVGIDYRFIEINPAFEKQAGLKDAIGKTILEMAPGMEDHWPRIYGNVARTGLPAHFTEEAVALQRWFNVYAFRLGDENSSRVAVFFTDITDKIKAEKDLKESDERFRKLADHSPIFVFIIEAEFDAPVSYWNTTWLDYTNQTMEEAIGRSWTGIIHPDDLNIVSEIYLPAFNSHSPYFIPAIRVKRHDGVYRWHAFKGNPRFSPGGEFNGYVGVGFDIHDQKLAEDALKRSESELQRKVQERTKELQSQKTLFDNILTNSSNGISVTEMIRDQNGAVIDARTILVNDAAVRHVGLPKEEYLSKTANEVDPNILQSDYGKTCLRTLETGEPSLSQYFVEMTGRWQELTISKMDDDHLIHIFTDITPIKQAQLQLERTIEELRKSNANLEEFAYAASHDLKEPLRKVLMFSDRIKVDLADKLSSQGRLYFERMETATKRMGSLIDDLLEYSYVNKGAVTDQSVDLNELLKVVLEDLELEIQDKQAEVHVEPMPEVKGFQRQLQQLFQNLVSNALKYQKINERPKVYISSCMVNTGDPLLVKKALPAGQSFYLLEVKDNGIGFEQENADRIFNVFTRLHGNAEYSGSGIGLSIAYKVAKNHNGEIWAESKPGEGASFKLLLPV